jgi:acyl transferase domain-containing protein
VRASRLTVSHAFHSALMEPILDEFAAVAATVTYAPPQIPLVTNRTGRLADAGEAAGNVATPAYWVRINCVKRCTSPAGWRRCSTRAATSSWRSAPSRC